MTAWQVLGWGAVGFVLLCLSLLGLVAVWATYKYIRDNHNLGGK